jgi:uncharacterized protein
MSHQGKFVWYELMTPDAAASKAFYRSVVGWGVKGMPMPGFEYTMLMAGETRAAGIMQMTDDAKKAGARMGWTGYVGVDDVDASTEKAKGLGATVCMPPMDIPTVGRFSVIQDPGGAVIALFRGAGEMPEEAPIERGTPGRIGWHEVYAADGQQALAFYQALFGWKKTEEMDMGAMGKYHIFMASADQGGGMMTKPPHAPAPTWLYYFNVESIEAAANRVKSAGGQVSTGPMEVPGGGWVLQGFDPQGAYFALYSLHK